MECIKEILDVDPQLTNAIVTNVGHTTRAIIDLIKISLSAIGLSVTIIINRASLILRSFASYNQFGLNVLKIATLTENVVGKLGHMSLDLINKVNNPKVIAIVLILLALYHGLKRMGLVDKWTNTVTSAFLARYTNISSDRTAIRKIFREATLTPGGEAPNVLHPKPRRDRLTAIRSIRHMISQIATYKPYHFQPRENQTDTDYRMLHYWPCDTSVPHRTTDIIEPDHFITQIDSDYYADMNDKDNLPFNPQVLYTFDPVEVAAKHTEYPAWTFLDSETLHVTSPSEEYEHKIWDYTSNEIRHLQLNQIINATFNVFEVEKRRNDTTHSLVLINPRVQYVGLAAFVAYLWYGEKKLERVNVGDGPFARMDTQHQTTQVGKTHTVSVSRKGTFLAATCDITEFQQMNEITLNSKLGCTVPKVKTKTSLTDAPAAVLTNYLNHIKKEEYGSKKWYKNYALEYAIRTHQYFPDTAATLDPKPAVVAFSNALFDGCHVHSNEIGSEIQAIEGRLTKLIRPFTLTPKHTEVMDEFIIRLVTEEIKGTLEPVDDDVVFEKQSKPTQQSILEYGQESNVRGDDRKPIISTFAKKEAAGKINDTRIISVVQPANKLRTSTFLYPLSDWLKKQKWYCFGKTPKRLANHLAKTAITATTLNCTDFSRMDGRKNIALRTFNYKLMVYLFGPEHAPQLRAMFEEGCNAKGFTPNIDDDCFVFETLMAWASGDPFTSSYNSLDNALIVFTGYVNSLTNNGATPASKEIYDEAYEALQTQANIAGDDTVLADMPDSSIQKAAEWWGHVLTSEVYHRGEQGVNFLARNYGPYLWRGDPNSCTDLMRALSKLHATPNMLGYTPVEKMEMKLSSLYFTDKNSPIIQDLLNLWLRVGGKLTDKYSAAFMSYWSQYDASEQYPNYEDDWMWETLPYEDIDEELFHEFLDNCQTVDEFLMCPTIWTQESKPMAEQQVVQTIGDEQTLVGSDENRIPQPTEQGLPDNISEVITTAPTDEEIKLMELVAKKAAKASAVQGKDILEDVRQVARKDKGKEPDEGQVTADTLEPISGLTATDRLINKTKVKMRASDKPVNKRKEAFFKEKLSADGTLTRKQLNRLYARHLAANKKQTTAVKGLPAQAQK